jgi:hypothetical protein
MKVRRERFTSVAALLAWSTCALVLALSVFGVAPAAANTYLGGTLSWQPRPDLGANVVQFDLIAVMRLRDDNQANRDVNGDPQAYPAFLNLNPTPQNPGDIFEASTGSTGNFLFGEALNTLAGRLISQNIRWKAISVNVQQNYVVAKMFDATSANTDFVIHQYPNAGPWLARTDNWCCRPEYDERNSVKGMRLWSEVDAGGPNGSPVSTQFDVDGIFKIATGGSQPQGFVVQAADATQSNTVLRFRAANRVSGETGSTQYQRPFGLELGTEIDPISGLVVWNTAAVEDGGAYSYMVVAEEVDVNTTDVIASCPIDMEFVLENVTTTGDPTFSPNGGNLTYQVNQPYAFSVEVSDPHSENPGNRVHVVASALPSGATYVSHNGYGCGGPVGQACNNPASTTGYFSWTPTNANAGLNTLTLDAYGYLGDKPGPNSQASWTILVNRPPDCSGATASIPAGPNDHLFQPVTISGVTDPDGDPVTITVTNIRQDEPVGSNCPDAIIKPAVFSAMVRRETVENEGNGRVYTIDFTATDNNGGSTTCSVTLCVPRTGYVGGDACANEGPIYLSLTCPAIEGSSIRAAVTELGMRPVGARSGVSTIEYALPSDGNVSLKVFDIAGRELATLENSHRTAGIHRVDWNTAGVPKGVYFYRLVAGGQVISKSIPLVR